MKFIAGFVAAFPFAGKIAIRNSLFSLYLSRTKKEKTARWWTFLFVMAFLIIGHALQAEMGMKGLRFSQGPTFFRLISAVYFVANTLITITQVYTLYRGTRFYLGETLKDSSRKYDKKKYSGGEQLYMLLVTVICQVVFFVPYEIYT